MESGNPSLPFALAPLAQSPGFERWGSSEGEESLTPTGWPQGLEAGHPGLNKLEEILESIAANAPQLDSWLEGIWGAQLAGWFDEVIDA
jgi:hypothetical protein